MTSLIGNGSMPLRIGNLIDTTVYGGPYRDRTTYFWGVKMAAEIDQRCDCNIPTEDFNVPRVADLRVGVVKALMAMITGREVYAGCAGGIGRTGLFLAALAKVQIEYRKVKHRPGRGEDPVLYVRRYYMSHAIETEQQKKYIADFDVSDIVNWLTVTQTAMGLGGLTPPREQPVTRARVNVFTHANVCAPPPYVKPAWIVDNDKIDNPAFDTYAQPWKHQRSIARLVERDLDWIDSSTADSASEVVDLDDDIRFDDLYTRTDELEDGLGELWRHMYKLQDATKQGFAGTDENFKNLLTKQTLLSRISGLFRN